MQAGSEFYQAKRIIHPVILVKKKICLQALTRLESFLCRTCILPIHLTFYAPVQHEAGYRVIQACAVHPYLRIHRTHHALMSPTA